jgi:hypothetical protein
MTLPFALAARIARPFVFAHFFYRQRSEGRAEP